MLTRQQRRALRRQKAKSPQQQSIRQLVAQQVMRALRWIWSLPLWADIVTVVGAGYVIYQAFYAMVPEIRPDAALSPSWTDLPFTAKNTGGLFDIHDAQFVCETNNVTWDAGSPNLIRTLTPLKHAVSLPPLRISTGATVTFPCDMAENAKAFGVKPDSSKTQLPIALMRMQIRTTYKINLAVFDWRREAVSASFTWRAVSGGYQWLEGDPSDMPKF
jgi:hypothetical protein